MTKACGRNVLSLLHSQRVLQAALLSVHVPCVCRSTAEVWQTTAEQGPDVCRCKGAAHLDFVAEEKDARQGAAPLACRRNARQMLEQFRDFLVLRTHLHHLHSPLQFVGTSPCGLRSFVAAGASL